MNVGTLLHLKLKKKNYRVFACAGCSTKISENMDYTEVVMRYEDRNEHIALCPKCAEDAKRYGVL